MQQQDRPTPETGATIDLHLIAGAWIAQCTTCGYEVAQATSQARAERKAATALCPVCHEAA